MLTASPATRSTPLTYVLLLLCAAAQGKVTAHYRLDEPANAGGVAIDSVTGSGAPLINADRLEQGSVPSPFNTAYDFRPDAIRAGGVALGTSAAVRPQSNWTVTCWARLDTLDAFDRLVESMNGTATTSRGIRIDLGSAPGNHIRMLLRDGTGAQLALEHTRVLSTGTWYFVAARFHCAEVATGQVTVIAEHDAQGGTIVPDSTRSATNAALRPIQFAALRPTVLGLEDTNGTPQNALDGRMDDVAFYDEVLTDDAVKFVRRFGAQSRLPAIAWDSADPGNAPVTAWKQNLGVAYQWTLTGGADSPTFRAVTSAYRITNALEFSGTGEAAINAALPNRNRNVSVEIWFKPRDLTEGDREVVFEAGGDANGFALLMEGPVLVLRFDQDSVTDLAGSKHLTAAHTLRPEDAADFVQTVAVVDLVGDCVHLYVNGKPVADASPPGAGTPAGNMTSWAGGNTEHIGSLRTNDTSGVGGDDGTDMDAFTALEGQIGLVRFYQDTVLDAAQVLANYEAMRTAVPLPSTIIILLAGAMGALASGKRHQ